MGKSTKQPAKCKKPHPDFPLFPHASGRWAKKVRGRFCYFGRVSTDTRGEAALALWLEQKDDLLAGRTPRKQKEGLTLRDLIDGYLTACEARVDAGELLRTTFDEYVATGKLVGATLGAERFVDDLAADDFRHLRAVMAKRWGPVRLANQIQRVRSIFKHGYDNGLYDKPVRFGTEFKKPSAKTLRIERARNGPRMFEAAEIRLMLGDCSPQVKAMILLGINCGFGCTDCATLPSKALDLKDGWVNYARTKTGVPRRCPLWPETIEALRKAIEARPAPKEGQEELVFIGRRGAGFAQAKQTHWLVSSEVATVLKRLKISRKGLGFYGLRHTFQTIAEAAHDLAAVQAIMGHTASASDMGARYRERIDDDRLRAVTEHVRTWLFPKEEIK